VDQQRQRVIDRPVEAEQHSKLQDELGNTERVGAGRRQRHAIEATGNANGRARQDDLLDAPLQEEKACSVSA